MVWKPPRDLFTSQANYRNRDPETSREAAIAAEKSGSAGCQRTACLRAVRDMPGSTAAEIAAYLELERHVPSRRLPELRRLGLVRNGPARICREQGKRSLTWWPQSDAGPLAWA